MRRAVAYEIRLSYYERILKTLPEAMHAPEVNVMPAQAPGPEYDYDDPCKSSGIYSYLMVTLVL